MDNKGFTLSFNEDESQPIKSCVRCKTDTRGLVTLNDGEQQPCCFSCLMAGVTEAFKVI